MWIDERLLRRTTFSMPGLSSGKRNNSYNISSPRPHFIIINYTILISASKPSLYRWNKRWDEEKKEKQRMYKENRAKVCSVSSAYTREVLFCMSKTRRKKNPQKNVKAWEIFSKEKEKQFGKNVHYQQLIIYNPRSIRLKTLKDLKIMIKYQMGRQVFIYHIIINSKNIKYCFWETTSKNDVGSAYFITVIFEWCMEWRLKRKLV